MSDRKKGFFFAKKTQRTFARLSGVWAVGLAFLVSILVMPRLGPVFARLFPGVSPPVYDRGSFLALAGSHISIVVAAILVAAMLGISAAILVTRPWGRAFRPLADTIATIGQTFPPAAVLAVLVPVMGFGARPTLIALILYGLLPITENTLAGLASIPNAVHEAARGMGLSPLQVLLQVELPLATPLIVAGLRTATIVSLGTATIGSTIGALTLGTPIIDGLVTNKTNFILQGAIPLALLAIFLELAFNRLECPTRVPDETV